MLIRFYATDANTSLYYGEWLVEYFDGAYLYTVRAPRDKLRTQYAPAQKAGDVFEQVPKITLQRLVPIDKRIQELKDEIEDEKTRKRVQELIKVGVTALQAACIVGACLGQPELLLVLEEIQLAAAIGKFGFDTFVMNDSVAVTEQIQDLLMTGFLSLAGQGLKGVIRATGNSIVNLDDVAKLGTTLSPVKAKANQWLPSTQIAHNAVKVVVKEGAKSVGSEVVRVTNLDYPVKTFLSDLSGIPVECQPPKKELSHAELQLRQIHRIRYAVDNTYQAACKFNAEMSHRLWLSKMGMTEKALAAYLNNQTKPQ